MEYQEALEVIIQFVGWGGLILISPLLFRFATVLTKYILDRIWPITTLQIEHEHNGIVIERKIIKLNSSIPLVRQLSDVDNKVNKS